MIQRWKYGKDVGMFKSVDGAWVKHSDHLVDLHELVEALEKVNRSLAAYIDHAPRNLEEVTYEPVRAYGHACEAIRKVRGKV